MKTRKAITIAASCFILVNIVLGWSNGQNPNTGNPTAKNCANAGCHGGSPPDSCAQILFSTLAGSGTWQSGTNGVVIQPVAATDTNPGQPGGFCGDTTLRCWNYTINFTDCNNQPIPINVYFHDCLQGFERIYQANGIYYGEIGNSPMLNWMTINGQPSNVSYLTSWCMLLFTVTNSSFQDSININIGLVLGNCDTIPGNDSTLFFSTKLAYSGQFSSHDEVMVLTGNYHYHPPKIEYRGNGVMVTERCAWQIVTADGRLLYEDDQPVYIELPTGLYYFRRKVDGYSKTISIR